VGLFHDCRDGDSAGTDGHVPEGCEAVRERFYGSAEEGIMIGFAISYGQYTFLDKANKNCLILSVA